MDRITRPERFGRSNRGFTLIELLIVIAIILVIAAFAIPRLLRAKISANEAAAVQSLRTISSSELIYSTIYGVGFSDSLTKLSGNLVIPDQNNAGLIDTALGSGMKSGYIFTFTVLSTDSSGQVQTYCVTADPQAPGSSGNRHFYMDQASVIRFNDSVTAGPGDIPIG
jgi:type IV pilus assembly protein PilA